MTKRFTSVAAALVLLMPLSAQAGNMADPVTPPAALPSSVAAMDWSGSYAGLSYGTHSGDIAFTPGGSFGITDGTAIALFGGYQVQRGNLVYGVELAINSIDRAGVAGFENTSQITDMQDLKGRLGYASGSFLVYGVLGFSTGIYNNNVNIAGSEWDIKGMNYGLGFDYAVTDNWVVGAEFLMRDVSGDNPSGFPQVVDSTYDTLSLRVSFQF